MAKFQFTSVLNAHAAAYKTAATGDAAAKKDHDRNVYAALMKPFAEVKAFYAGYEKLIDEAKLQCKSNMDAIEATIKKTKGRPSEAEMKLLKGSHEHIQGFVKVLKANGGVLQNDMMDWRGGWDATAAKVLFDTKMVESMKGFRKQLIDKQSGTWNALTERVDQYNARADALMAAVAKSAKTASPDDGDALAKLQKAHEDCVSAGPKGFRTYAENVNNELPRMKTEAKDGIDSRDKPKAAVIWKGKEPKMEQFAAYAKSFSGAEKTLDMLLKSVSTAAKGVAKPQAAAWAKLKSEIEADLAIVKTATKQHTEAVKYIDKITAHYKAAIKG